MYEQPWGDFSYLPWIRKELIKIFYGEINIEDKWTGIFPPSFVHKEESYYTIDLKPKCKW